RMAVHGRRYAGIDLMHQRVEHAGGAVAVPAHEDAGTQAPGGLLELHVLLADDALAVIAPLLEEFLPALFLDVIVGGGRAGMRGHGVDVLSCRTSFHLVARSAS